MKHLDTFTKRLLVGGLISIGLLLSGALFVSSIQQASADPLSPVGAAGKYQMHYITYYNTNSNKYLTQILVWDTESGASKVYYYNSTDKKMKDAGAEYQLPTPPL